MKQIVKTVLILCISLFLSGLVQSQNKDMVDVSGKITFVAKDGTSLKVDSQTIVTTPDLVEDAMFEIDDTVIITAEKTSDGLKAVAYRYVYEEAQVDVGEESPADNVIAEDQN